MRSQKAFRGLNTHSRNVQACIFTGEVRQHFEAFNLPRELSFSRPANGISRPESSQEKSVSNLRPGNPQESQIRGQKNPQDSHFEALNPPRESGISRSANPKGISSRCIPTGESVSISRPETLQESFPGLNTHRRVSHFEACAHSRESFRGLKTPGTSQAFWGLITHRGHVEA